MNLAEKIKELSLHHFPKSEPLMLDTDHIMYLTN